MALIRGLAALLGISAALGAQSYTAVVAGSGYQTPPPIFAAPGQIATFFVGGLPQTSAGLANLVAVINVSGQLETVQVLSAKSMNTETLAITVQFPFTGLPAVGVLNGFLINTAPFQIQFAETDNPSGDPCAEGACSVPFTVEATFAQPHLINTCDLFLNSPAVNGNCTPAILHQNGSVVTFGSPAAPGEILTAWAVGLGAPSGGIPSGAAGPIAMNDITISLGFLTTTVNGSFTSTGEIQVPNPTYLWAGLPNPSQGLYQINFAVPPSPPGLGACTATAGNFYVGFGRDIESAGFTGGILAIGSPVCVATN